MTANENRGRRRRWRKKQPKKVRRPRKLQSQHHSIQVVLRLLKMVAGTLNRAVKELEGVL